MLTNDGTGVGGAPGRGVNTGTGVGGKPIVVKRESRIRIKIDSDLNAYIWYRGVV